MARILIIDDSKVIRELLTEFLTEEGYAVESAGDADEGIELANTGQFDLVISDLHLPGKTGFDIYCAVAVRKPDLPFLFTDSMPDQIALQVSSIRGAVCLRKPFDLEQLRQTVEKALNPARVR